MSQWNERLAEAIAAIGGERFPERLEAALSSLMSYTICMVFSYEGAKRPKSLYHNIAPEFSGVVIRDYCAGPYLLDPFYAGVMSGQRSGILALRATAPRGFFKSEYYQKHYSRTGIKDELGVVAALSPIETAVVSIARKKEEPVFSIRERGLFADVAPVVSALMVAHWGNSDSTVRTGEAGEAPQLSAILHRIEGSPLTPRESEVLELILKGYSSVAISAVLDISEGTTKVHRKNAYRKLNISSQAELFSRFLEVL